MALSTCSAITRAEYLVKKSFRLSQPFLSLPEYSIML